MCVSILYRFLLSTPGGWQPPYYKKLKNIEVACGGGVGGGGGGERILNKPQPHSNT